MKPAIAFVNAVVIGCVASILATPLHAQLQMEPPQMVEWRHHSFKGRTSYRLAEIDGRQALRASCSLGASGLFLEKSIELAQTPILEWSWRVDDLPHTRADQRTRAGDDFAARVYVVMDGGLLRWRTRAISYVWANESPVGSNWPNPHVEQAQMVVVRSGPAAGVWHTERRNIREDFRRYHRIGLERVDAIAIMTDCDDTGGKAEAWYGPMRFLPANR